MGATELTLEEVLIQFETWREARKGREPIPEELWQAAVDLTETLPPGKIARTLGLSRAKLKKRAGAAEAALPIKKEPVPGFSVYTSVRRFRE